MSDKSDKRNIVIIGGGIIGCSTAYFLTRHPSYDPAKHSVTILEASKIAGGASGKAGGLLALWAYPRSIVPLSYRMHAELAKEHNGADRWGYRRIHCGQLSAKGRLPPSKGDTGSKQAGEAVSLQKRSKEAIGTLRAAGIPSDLDWFSADCVSDYNSMGDPNTTAQIHPYQFTTSMAALAEERSARVLIGRATSINNSSTNTVESVTYTDSATQTTKTLPASDVVISAGPWTRSIFPLAPIIGLRAHSVTVRPSRPVSAYALFTEITLPAIGTSRKKHVTPEIYARPNNEIYACGEGDTLVPLPPTTADVETDPQRCQDIVDHITSISDELRDGEVLVRQACYLPNVAGAVQGPFVGPTGVQGLWMAAGHTCWGIQNGPGTGKLMSEFIFDGKAQSAKIKDLDPRQVL